MRRRLTVILAADVAGYSRLVAAAEEATIQQLRTASEIFTNLVAKNHGRVFQSAVDATRCAMDFQEANNAQNVALAADRRLLFRIGIAIGDVLVTDGGDLLGDGVNIAARIERLAEPGSVCISDDVRSHVANKIEIGFVDLGEQTLKNIPLPVRAFKLVVEGAVGSPAQPKPPRQRVRPAALIWIGSATAAVLVVAAALFFWARGTHTDAGEPFDAAKIPLIDARAREQLAGYARQPDPKAIAISQMNFGVQVGAPDIEAAKRMALERCEQELQKTREFFQSLKGDPKLLSKYKPNEGNGGYCRLYAVGNMVVYPRSSLPMPMPADLRTEPLRDVNADWLFIYPLYMEGPNHRALAVRGPGQTWSSMGQPSGAEAIRIALERCADQYQLPCTIVAVDGRPTVRMPERRKVAGMFTLAGEGGMTDADRQRIAQIYGGPDWRALAKGHSGQWYAINGAASEIAAEEKALALCRATEPQCELYAINNFRVGELKSPVTMATPPECAQLKDTKLTIETCKIFLGFLTWYLPDGHKRAEAYFYLATALGMNGRVVDAIAGFDEAIKADPGWAPPYNNRGRALVGAGEPAKAVADYTRALAINPRDAETYVNRALAYLKLKDRDHALADLQRGTELDPRNAFALYNLGLLYEGKGDRARAEAAYRKVLTLVPDDAHARESLNRLDAKSDANNDAKRDVKSHAPDDGASRP